MVENAPVNRRAPAPTHARGFLTAPATFMLQVLLTRITSLSARDHLPLCVISLAMLGMTAGAVLVFLLPQLFTPERIPQRLVQSALAFAIAIPICTGAALTVPLTPVVDLMSFVALFAVASVLALPFVLGG